MIKMGTTQSLFVAGAIATVCVLGCKSVAEQNSLGLSSDVELRYSVLSVEECVTLFPAGIWVDLLATKNIWERFFELADKNSPDGGWIYEPGTLKSFPGGVYSQLASRCAFANFEMEFDWSIATGANSGVKYLVDAEYGPVGLEYQILDDISHPDAKIGPKRQAGALYDVVEAPVTKKLNPPGTVNHSRVMFKNGIGEHWLNGERLLTFDVSSADFAERVKISKFKKMSFFGHNGSGQIMLQHHGDAVTFTKLTVRALN